MTASTSPTSVPQTTLGDGLVVSALGFGAMAVAQVYGSVSHEQGLAALHSAIDQGMTFIDTANIYASGENERLVGEVLRDRRDEVTLATKFGIVGFDHTDPDAKPGARGDHDFVIASCDESLSRLGIDTIDLCYVHRRDVSVPIEETVGAMAELVAAGKVRHLGLSEVTAGEIAAASAVHPIAAVQSEWSLWSRDVETGVVPAAVEHGVGFVPYSPLGRGFLTGTVTALSDNDFRTKIPRFAGTNMDANAAVVDVVRGVGAELDATPAQVSLAWLLARAAALGVASVPIPGTRNPERITENIGSLSIVLSDDQMSRLDAAADLVVGQRSTDPNWVSQGRE